MTTDKTDTQEAVSINITKKDFSRAIAILAMLAGTSGFVAPIIHGEDATNAVDEAAIVDIVEKHVHAANDELATEIATVAADVRGIEVQILAVEASVVSVKEELSKSEQRQIKSTDHLQSLVEQILREMPRK